MSSATNTNQTINKTTMISTLPDLCLLTIFDSVPLMELGNVFLTCRRWNSFRSWVLSRRTRLHLGTGKLDKSNDKSDDDDRVVDLDRLSWSALTPELAFHLTRSLFRVAKIRELTLENKFDSLDEDLSEIQVDMTASFFSLLLQMWAEDKTKSIHKISLYLDPLPNPLAIEHLLQAISAMHHQASQCALRILVLDFSLLEPYIRDRTLFPVLGSLTRLETNPLKGDDLVEFCQWLAVNHQRHQAGDQHNTNKRYWNRRLKIHMPTEKKTLGKVTQDQVEVILGLRLPLHQLFTGTVHEPEECTFEQLNRYLAHFPRLTAFTYTVNLDKLTLVELSRALCQLSQLRVLTLNHLPWDKDEEEQHLGRHQLRHLYRPLPSVRQLKLNLTDDDLRLEEEEEGEDEATNRRPYLPTVFPGLVELSVDHKGSINHQFDMIAPLLVRQVVRPFLDCLTLLDLVFMEVTYSLYEPGDDYRYTPEVQVEMLCDAMCNPHDFTDEEDEDDA